MPRESELIAWQALNPRRNIDGCGQLLFDRHSVGVALEITGRLCEYLDSTTP